MKIVIEFKNFQNTLYNQSVYILKKENLKIQEKGLLLEHAVCGYYPFTIWKIGKK